MLPDVIPGIAFYHSSCDIGKYNTAHEQAPVSVVVNVQGDSLSPDGRS
jgi:hypothetical protein